MRQRVIPLLAPETKRRQNGDSCYETRARGLAVLNSPQLNKGTAFTAEERKALGLTGLLPPDISTLGAQVKRAYIQYERLPDSLSKNIYLTALHDRNEVLFYRLFSEHLREMIPIVNDLTVGMAMEQYHHECRRPRGVYLSIDHAEAIEEAFANLGAGSGDIDLILATDAEQILGIGDWGVGGIEVSIGKLAIYTAAGGIDPTRVIPVMLDVGTNREESAGRPYVHREPARPDPRRAVRRLHRRLRRSRDEAVPKRTAAVGGLRTRQRTAYPREVPRPDLHVQRRHAGHRRNHAGGGHLGRPRLRNAAAQPARGDLRSGYGRYWNRRPDSRCDGT